MADPLDGIRQRPAARQRPGAAGHGGYVCAVLAFVMLVSLYKFLRRIEAGAVFVPANVTALRRISWCCAGAAVVCLAAAYIYLPFAFLGVAAAFMALIVRVLKNALCPGRPHEGRA